MKKEVPEHSKAMESNVSTESEVSEAAKSTEMEITMSSDLLYCISYNLSFFFPNIKFPFCENLAWNGVKTFHNPLLVMLERIHTVSSNV